MIGWLDDLGHGIGRGIVTGAQKIGGAVRKIPGQLHPQDDEEPSFINNERPPIALPGMNGQGGAQLPQRQPMRRLDPAQPLPQSLPEATPPVPTAVMPPHNPQPPLTDRPAFRPRLAPEPQPIMTPPPEAMRGSLDRSGRSMGGDSVPVNPIESMRLPQSQTASVETSAPQSLGQAAKRNVNPVMVPPLPGSHGQPLEDTPYNRARYEYVTETMDDKGHIPRSFKGTLQNAGLGAIRAIKANPQGGFGALAGGAVGGGAEALISPTAGRTSVFNDTHGRAIQADEQRQAQRQTQQQETEAGRLKNEHLKAQTDAITEGKARDNYIPMSGGGLYDIENHDFIREPNDPAQASRLPAHYQQVANPDGTVSTVNVADPKNAGLKYRPYEKPTKPADDKAAQRRDAAVEAAIKQHGALKSAAAKADAANQVAQAAARANPKDKVIADEARKADEAFRGALEALNAHAQSINDNFGDELEGGIGDKNYGYVKRKTPPSGGQSAPQGKKGGSKINVNQASQRYPGINFEP